MSDGLTTVLLDPAFVLSLLVGSFHTCVYLFVRGKLGWHLPAVLVAAIFGALAGQAIGSRVGDILELGDYNLLWASAFAWLGIGIAVVSSALVSRRPTEPPPPPGGEVRPREDDSG
jgi:hypothetical protein